MSLLSSMTRMEAFIQLFFNRYRKCDLGSFAQGTLQSNRAAQQVDIPFYDMKTQPGSLDIHDIPAPEKRSKQMLLVFFRYAHAFVLNSNKGGVAFKNARHPYFARCL